MSTKEVTWKFTNLCLVFSSQANSSSTWVNFLSLVYFHLILAFCLSQSLHSPFSLNSFCLCTSLIYCSYRTEHIPWLKNRTCLSYGTTSLYLFIRDCHNASLILLHIEAAVITGFGYPVYASVLLNYNILIRNILCQVKALLFYSLTKLSFTWSSSYKRTNTRKRRL